MKEMRVERWVWVGFLVCFDGVSKKKRVFYRENKVLKVRDLGVFWDVIRRELGMCIVLGLEFREVIVGWITGCFERGFYFDMIWVVE